MSVPAELNEASIGEEDDALRALVSSMLSGRYKEELYLSHVFELCRDQPESAPSLLGLIDRSYRLGRMPAEQYQKIKAKIEQAMGTRPPDDAPANQPVDERANQPALDDDVDSPEMVTRELRAVDATAPNPAATPPPRPRSGPRRASPPPQRTTAPPPKATAPPARSAPATPRAAVVPPPVGVAAGAPAAKAPEGAEARAATQADALHVTISIGTVLRERYELLELVGRGGMASVYKARDLYRTRLGVAHCYVAVKIVQPHPLRPGSVDALGREFHNAQRLSHPNVVNVYDIDHEGDASFYTMELLEGERLNQLVQRAGGRLPRRYALAVIRDIGAAIAHAHSRGVVHADLKPHNIMITDDGHVRVLDFGSGIVRPGEPWISELSPGGNYRQATPAYASCEQLQGWVADPRDDIYALACLAYQLLAGKHPFEQRSALVARGRRMRPRRPAAISGEGWRALRRGLAWSREQRNMTTEKWLEQIGIADAAESLPPLSRLSNMPPPRHWPRRVAAAAVVLLSLGLAAFAIKRQAGVDWPQTLAGAQSTWDHLWQQLQSPWDSSTLPAATPAHEATARALPAPWPAVGAPVTAPRLPSANRSRATRVASTGEAPPAIAASGIAAPGIAAPAMAAVETVSPPAADANSSRVAFAATSYAVSGSEPAARIVVQRLGSIDGDVTFSWWTEGASAQPEVDYASLGRRIEHIPSGTDKLTVYVPIISNPQRSRLSQFYVALAETGSGATGAPSARATVTIDRGY
jgi:serine/threonine protein kinase